MYFKDTYHAIIRSGTEKTGLDKQAQVIKVNTIALLTGTLALVFGLFFYAISKEKAIVAGTTVEALAYYLVIFLNKKGRYDVAALTAQVIPNLATLYFGVILAAVIEASLLAIFLVGTSFLVIENRKYRACCLALTFLVLILLQVNSILQLVPPIIFSPLNHQVIHYSAIIVVFSLNIAIIAFYVKQNDSLLQALKVRSEKLEKANDYKSVFVRETNHEIRVPLNAIYSISQLLLADAARQPELRAIRPQAEHLCAASHHALDIINNVLELSRIEAGKLHEVHNEPFEMKGWIEGIVHTSQYIARTRGVRIALEYNKLALPERIVSDRLKLTQIVNNLLFNAIKFTAPDSTVQLAVTAEGDRCYIKVKDQGQGIAPEKMDAIFDPFISGESGFSDGTGLGLHIARHLAELLNGAITVESEVGKGTVFCMAFPLLAYHGEEEDAAVVLAEALESISYIGMKMLVVEDDYMSRVYLERYLSGLGVQVLTAASGAEALAVAATQLPDLVITDRHLPDVDGGTLLSRFREMPQLRGVPVIVASGDAFAETREQALREGADAYIIKPIDFKLLNLLLNKCLNKTALV